MKKLLTDATVMSIGLLGVFCNIAASGAPISSCQELALLSGDPKITPSAPAATGGSSTLPLLNVYIRGIDDRVYEWTISTQSWFEVPGKLTISEPSAIVFGTTVYLFVRGGDNRIYTANNSSGWSAWSEVKGDGQTLSGPAAVGYLGGRKLFVRGLDNRIYENDFVGGDWSIWSPVPGEMRTISAPTAISYASLLYLFVRGENNRIYMNTFDGATWFHWSEVPFTGGLTLAGPSALVHANMLRLFITGLDDGIWENDLTKTGNRLTDSFWSGWSEISDSPLTPSAPAAVEVFGSSPELLYRSEDGRVFNCFF